MNGNSTFIPPTRFLYLIIIGRMSPPQNCNIIWTFKFLLMPIKSYHPFTPKLNLIVHCIPTYAIIIIIVSLFIHVYISRKHCAEDKQKPKKTFSHRQKSCHKLLILIMVDIVYTQELVYASFFITTLIEWFICHDIHDYVNTEPYQDSKTESMSR